MTTKMIPERQLTICDACLRTSDEAGFKADTVLDLEHDTVDLCGEVEDTHSDHYDFCDECASEFANLLERFRNSQQDKQNKR